MLASRNRIRRRGLWARSSSSAGQHGLVVRPDAHDQHHLGDVRTRRLGELGHLGDQRRRQVVDHEPAEVLEVVRRLRTSGTGQTGDHHELVHDDQLTVGRLVVRGPSREQQACQRLATTRSSRRGTVAASVYSGARARKPGGGAGSSMRSSRGRAPPSR